MAVGLHDSPGVGVAAIDLADFMRREGSSILRRWEQRAHLATPAHDQPRSKVMIQLPTLFEQIIQNVERAKHGAATVPEDVSREHARARIEQGYRLGEVVGEYIALRDCIFERLEELDGVIGPHEARELNAALDNALQETAIRFTARYEKMLAALDRIAGAATRRELDDVLTDVLRAVKDSCGADVDSVAIVLAGDDGRLRFRATVGLDVPRGFSLGFGEGFAGRVAEMRRAFGIRDAANDPMVTTPAIRERGTRALYGIPLMDGDDVIGVAHIGSTNAYEFSNEDVMFFRAMCERATALINRTQWVEKLARTAQFREQVLGMLGHDLRAPLSAILGTAQQLASKKNISSSEAEAYRRISRSARRMDRLIGDLLDFSRARLGGSVPLTLTSFSLRNLVKDVSDELTPLLSERKLTIGAENEIVGTWDRDRIAQVVSNLVANAIKHSPDGAQIRVSLRTERNFAVLEVFNEGSPISPGEKVFEPFERGGGPGRGLGLGLFIAREMVVAHKGSISYCSTMGSAGGEPSGTTFTVRLPLQPAAS
jgi:signal transduction histidine kinase